MFNHSVVDVNTILYAATAAVATKIDELFNEPNCRLFIKNSKSNQNGKCLKLEMWFYDSVTTL